MSKLSEQIERLEQELLNANNSTDYYLSEYQQYFNLYHSLKEKLDSPLAKLLVNCTLAQELEIEEFVEKMLKN